MTENRGLPRPDPCDADSIQPPLRLSKVELCLTNPVDTEEIKKLFRASVPFFRAADYQPPGQPMA
jgi:hypothetical protein